MSAITLRVSDELAERLHNQENRLSEILELGLRELNAGTQNGFAGAAEVLEFLAGLPSPEEILNLRPSERLQARVHELLPSSERTLSRFIDTSAFAVPDPYTYGNAGRNTVEGPGQ